MLDENFEFPLPDSYQKKVIESKPGSKLNWGSAFSGKTMVLCLRAKALLEVKVSPIILCFSSHHRFLIRKYLVKLNINEKIIVYTFKEWMLKGLSQNNTNPVGIFTRVINREESLLWLKKHQNQWSGNDDPEKDLEIIWTEKIFSPVGQPSDYQELVANYQNYLNKNHLLDEIDLCFLFEKNMAKSFGESRNYFLIDEVQEASILELQLLSKLLTNNTLELFVDYNQGVMAWRTPLPPISLKEFKKLLKVKKYYYLKYNYYNTKAITNCGLKLLRKNKNRISKSMKIVSMKKGDLHFYLFETKEEEGLYLAEKIQKWVKDPLHQDEKLGILVRNHMQAQEISVYLEGILASPYFARSLFRQPSAQKICALLRVLLACATDIDYDILMNSWADSKQKITYFDLKNSLEKHQLYFSNLLKINKSFSWNLNGEFIVIQKVFSPTDKSDIFTCEKWCHLQLEKAGTFLIEKSDDQPMQVSFENDGEQIWQELLADKVFGFYRGYYAAMSQHIPGLLFMEKAPILNAENLNESNLNLKISSMIELFKSYHGFIFEFKKFIDDLKAKWNKNNPDDLMSLLEFSNIFENADDFSDLKKLNHIFLSLKLKHLTAVENFEKFSKLSRSSASNNLNSSQVSLCTIHEGRHLQFHQIFMPRLNQFEFPHGQSCAGNKLEEERRLFYTGLMRSKQSVILSSVKKNNHISSFIREAGVM